MLETNQIHLGDCRQLLSQVDSESVSLIVTSPPYNIGKEYESRTSLENYLKDQGKVIRECHRVLKPMGSIFWQVGAYSKDGHMIPLDIKLYPIFEKLGMICRNRITWIKTHGVHAKKRFSCRHETLLWFAKSQDHVFNLDKVRVPQKYPQKKHYTGVNKGKISGNPLGKNPGDVWFFGNVKHNHQEQTLHPCQFPENLVLRCVLSTTQKGDLVLDPYSGSGTVAIVAQENERTYLGFEANPQYHALSLRRLSGEPNSSLCFPNLKTLRSYVSKNGAKIENYKFDRQKGAKASLNCTIKAESERSQEILERLSLEEDVFSRRERQRDRPS